MTASETVAFLVGAGAVPLWGLDGGERLRRQLGALGVTRVLGPGGSPPVAAAVLFVRADYLFDDRTLRDLLGEGGNLVLMTSTGANARAAAARVWGNAASQAWAVVAGEAGPGTIPDASLVTPASLSSGYVGKLLRASVPLLLPIRADCADRLERHLFDSSYKGVTDLVTKWVWPAPARAATRLCANLGIGPNAVTTMSFLLAAAATVLFARGAFAAGLLVGWLMTFLDTVDGKLARVTVTSTPFGHLFDHAIDIVHPPLWYLAWGWGVVGDYAELSSLATVLAAILAGYVVGRLIEGAFYPGLADFSMFIWRPFDSYFRLVTARRNPNLLLLSGFALAGLHRLGLVAVAWWTVLSTIGLAVRLAMGAFAKLLGRELQPWLRDLGDDPARVPAYALPFVSDVAALRRLND